ncbi:hypothetical protein Tco_0188559, partial [Tanacetum coccineum]
VLYDPSPRPSPTPHIPDSIPEVSGGNHGGYRSSKGNKTLEGTDQEAQESSQTCYYTPQSLDEECILEGRKSAKAEPSVHKDPLFDELDDDEIDNIDTEDAQDVGRTRHGVNAEKEGTEDVVSTDKEKVSTDRSKVSTNRLKDSTDKEEEGTDKDKDSTVSLDEGTDDRTKARSATPITS